jgi:hypothetical protein
MSKVPRLTICFGLILLLTLPAALHGQQQDEFDNYKLRLDAYWFYSNPSGTIQGNSDTVPVDFDKDLGFNTYSTFSGKADWKFTHKNHFYVSVSPFYTTRQTTLTRDITFQGQTFAAGTSVNSNLHALLVAPGYQYDIIRRKRGHLGLGVQFDLFNTSAKISESGQANGAGETISARGSLLAPIPVAGPEFRLYLTNSPRLFIEGNVYGMYFFGYGNFVSTADTVGLTLNRYISLNAGYQLGSRLVVTNTTDRVGIHLTQKGPIAGLEVSF